MVADLANNELLGCQLWRWSVDGQGRRGAELEHESSAYVRSIVEGPWVISWPSGVVRMRGTFRKGHLVAPLEFFERDGTPFRRPADSEGTETLEADRRPIVHWVAPQCMFCAGLFTASVRELSSPKRTKAQPSPNKAKRGQK